MRGREVATSPSGAMVIRKFYVEPFWAFETIIQAVEGFVLDGNPPERFLPVTDCYFVNYAGDKNKKQPLMYASEVRVTAVDRNDVSISNTVSMSRGEYAGLDQLRADLNNVNYKELNEGGAFIEVIYRPEFSAMQWWGATVTNAPEGEAQKVGPDVFDYLDPMFKSKTVYIPCPDGLLSPTGSINIHSNFVNVPPEMVKPIPINVVDFTIRRSLVPWIPWDTIGKCIGKVNDGDWKPNGTTLPEGASADWTSGFPDRTLKFNGPISIKRGLSSQGQQREWFEIIYWFEWIHQWTDDLWTFDGRHYEGAPKLKKTSGYVTWQDAFLSPKWQPFGILDDGALGQTGWYPLYRRKLEDTGLGFKVGVPSKEIYDTCSTQDLDDLFDISSK